MAMLPRILVMIGGLLLASAVCANEDQRVIPLPPVDADAVYDITVHDAAQMQTLLERLQTLAAAPKPGSELPRIALVLHGPEVNFFAIRNYPQHRALVDLAARLDAFGLIEVKACQTRMQSLGLEAADMPAFIELVPFGPDEVDKLNDQGAERYVYM